MIDQAVVLFGTPARVYGDVRVQRKNGVLDDAWEVHLIYNNQGSGVAPDENGLHTGGFRAILKGSTLTRDHALRYAVHGENGSWLKTGMDTQEPELLLGALPTYPPIVPPAGDIPLEAEAAAYTYGSEPRSQWGVLTTISAENPATATSVVTPSLQGNYHLIYDEVYKQIVNRAEPSVDRSVVPTVLRVIELARQSSREGRVLDFSFA